MSAPISDAVINVVVENEIAAAIDVTDLDVSIPVIDVADVGMQGPKGDPGPQGIPGMDTLETYADLGDRTGAVTIDYNVARWQRMRLTGNVTLTLTNLPAAPVVGALFLMLVQDATGGRSVTWPAGTKWPQAGTPMLSTQANWMDLFQLTIVNGVIHGIVGGWGYQ